MARQKETAPVCDPEPEKVKKKSVSPREIGGPSGPEPTRYGDWERNGKVSDF